MTGPAARRSARAAPALVALAALVAASGCALLSNPPPLEVRYFSPEGVDRMATARPAEPVAELRLGRIGSSANLRSHIVHRDSAFELGEYETLRWTENPEVYLRRALTRSLFEEGPFRQSLALSGARLDVTLIAFEERRHGAARSGRVQLRYELQADDQVLQSGVVTVERPAETGAGFVGVVVAIGKALDQASAELAAIAAERLRPR